MIKKFFHHVLPGVIKPMRVLWNEIIGFIFLALAVWTVPAAYRHVRDFNGEGDSLFRLILSCLFALLMIYFGVTSFLKAKKISRS